MSRLRLLEEAERLEGNLTEFVRAAWPSIDATPYQDSWAIEALCDHLEAVTLGQIPRLLVNFPPRCGKTKVASVCWPAFTWAQRRISYLSGPQVQFLCGSYNHDLSLQNSNQTRRLIQSPWYQARWGDRFELRADQNTKTQFDNDKGGSRIATSVGGSLLGIGGSILLVDDPHNTEEAESEADRARALNWWRELSSTRLNDPKRSAIVVVMQRLHTQDVTGVIQESDDVDRWVQLVLPMRYEERRHCVTVKLPQYEGDEPWEDPRRTEGELLWPERFGDREVASMERALGPYMASGRLQQLPRPSGGGILRSEWWQPWGKEEATRYGLTWEEDEYAEDGRVLRKGRREFPEFSFVVASLDGAFGQKQENDPSALTVWGRFSDLQGNDKFMLVYAWEGRLALHELVTKVAQICKKYRVDRLLIEAKANGHDVASEMKRLHGREKWLVELIDPGRLDKIARAHSVVPLFAEEMIYAPNTTWAQMVINQAEDFPKAEHDDLVDTVTQAIRWLRDNNLAARNEEIAGMMAEEAMNWKRPQTPLYPGV